MFSEFNELISQLSNPIFGIAVLANFALAVVVWRFAPKDRARYFFVGFVLSQILWVTANYFSFISPSDFFLLAVRLTLTTAGIHSFMFLLFIKSFLSDAPLFRKGILKLQIAACVVVSLLTLSPYVFSGVEKDFTGQLIPRVGTGIMFFGAYVAICMLWGFFVLVQRARKAVGIQKTQWIYLASGLTLTFLFVLLFSFFNFAVLGDASTVRFGHLYTLPFVIFTAYAIVKHRLLNLKTIAAEVAVIFLNLLLLVQVIGAQGLANRIVAISVLLGALIVGVWLIKGVYREVHQREQLEVLNGQLDAANEKLKDLDKARAEFISIASHQLRTPPATIKWYLSAIKSGDYGKFDDTVKEALVKAEVTNNAQISLIDDLLNASRIERGKMEFLFEEGDLVALAQMAFDQLVPQASMKKIKMIFNKPADAFPWVIMDKEKLRQVINNFIDNSIKYTKEGSVTVSITRDAETLGVRVTDTGKGFTPELGPVLFEKYTRGKDSVMHSTGLGLGLYVAKVIVEKHNGKIWAESKGEGQGSSFCFTVPLHNTIEASSTGTLDLTESQDEHK